MLSTMAMAMLGIVIYLNIEGALYAQKSVPSWFLAVFDSKIDVCWNLKKVVNSLIHLVSACNSQISWIGRITFPTIEGDIYYPKIEA